MSDANKIIDTNFGDGTDTAYHLGLGYHVVVMEPNQPNAADIRQRFQDQIKT